MTDKAKTYQLAANIIVGLSCVVAFGYVMWVFHHEAHWSTRLVFSGLAVVVIAEYVMNRQRDETVREIAEHLAGRRAG